MRSLAVCLFCLAVPSLMAPVAHAGDINADHRGTWTESGACPEPRRIVVGDKSVTLIEPGMTRLLTDGDEAVFKGETIINASLPAKKEQDPVLAFSAKVVEQDGELTLVTTGLEQSKAFAGTFKRCSGETRTAAAKPKPQKRKIATQRSPAARTYYAPGPLLGGLY